LKSQTPSVSCSALGRAPTYTLSGDVRRLGFEPLDIQGGRIGRPPKAQRRELTMNASVTSHSLGVGAPNVSVESATA